MVFSNQLSSLSPSSCSSSSNYFSFPHPPPTPNIRPHRFFFVSICPLRIFVLGKEQAETMQNGGGKVCVAQSLDVLLQPFHAFEVFPRPIMHLEVVWCEAEEHSVRGGRGCAMWVRLMRGEVCFRGDAAGFFILRLRCPTALLMVLVLFWLFLAPPACLDMEMRAHGHVTHNAFVLACTQLRHRQRERVSHTHTQTACVCV